MTDTAQQTFRYVYDTQGRIESGTDGEPRQRFHNTFDDQGRILAQDEGVSGNSLLQISYTGLQRTVTDRMGHTRVYTLSDDYRLLSFQNALGQITSYTYNEQNQLATQTDANNHTI